MKSRDRVKSYGEVFTPRHMANQMLDLVDEELETCGDFLDKTFLEPAAGDGNFLVAIPAACLKYTKSKFARAMFGILKGTQDNKRHI